VLNMMQPHINMVPANNGSVVSSVQITGMNLEIIHKNDVLLTLVVKSIPAVVRIHKRRLRPMLSKVIPRVILTPNLIKIQKTFPEQTTRYTAVNY